ncbi:MAG: hypothetical protein C4560_06765 [Nitrospiraceae bacterium]|nr:MAG: hypothetical protein C4560_06765 [Nitrospiraceae bacterium]
MQQPVAQITWGGPTFYLSRLRNDGKVTIKYVLALLNSKLIDWFYGFTGKPKGKAREYFNKPLSLISIKKISSANQHPFISLVNQILTAKKKDPPTEYAIMGFD